MTTPGTRSEVMRFHTVRASKPGEWLENYGCILLAGPGCLTHWKWNANIPLPWKLRENSSYSNDTFLTFVCLLSNDSYPLVLIQKWFVSAHTPPPGTRGIAAAGIWVGCGSCKHLAQCILISSKQCLHPPLSILLSCNESISTSWTCL